jgi:hypothetical protein
MEIAKNSEAVQKQTATNLNSTVPTKLGGVSAGVGLAYGFNAIP